MPKVNEFTEIVHLLKDEIISGKKTAAKSKAIPFGQERVQSRAVAVNRFNNLSPGDKQRYIQEQGLDNVLKMLRGGK